MATVNRLNSFFTNLITDLMAIERQPLSRLEKQRDSLNLRSRAYSEAKGKLSALQGAVKALLSSSFSSALTAGRAASISDVPSGYKVLSASVSSSAMAGVYTISVSQLASAHRVRSSQQTYADQALGLSGTFLLGGEAARSATLVAAIANTLTQAASAAPASGQTELGSGSYYVETCYDVSAGWQFRLVDADGNAVNIRLGDSDNYTSAWQAIPAGGDLYDSGRGLTLTFGADSGSYQAASRGAGAAQVDYLAQGATITVAATDSLNDIAAKINVARYAEGMGVTATVVDRQLVLAAATSGSVHRILASDVSGSVLSSLGILGVDGGEGDNGSADGFRYTLEEGRNAVFTVNGLQVSRSRNSGLSDVISGVTLDLAADAQGRSATLTISQDWSGALAAIDEFVTQFNATLLYLEEKTAVTRLANGDAVTYVRGSLAEDNVFSELRLNLLSTTMGEHANAGVYRSLRQIGLQINDNLRLSISDRQALQTALSEHYEDVVALMDQVMGDLNTTLGHFTGVSGESGYLDTTVKLVADQISEVNREIGEINLRLAEREQYLAEQYGAMQAQLLSLAYYQELWAGIYGSVNRYT